MIYDLLMYNNLINECPISSPSDRDARYTKWKMAVQRSLGWATTKKSITMTGQARRRNSILTQNLDPLPRKSSLDHSLDFSVNSCAEETNAYVEELVKYSARKFSIFVPVKSRKPERTILDDAEFFASKKECDYGACECCVRKKVMKDWASVEEMIENDPEIIFDSDDNPIVVEPVRRHVSVMDLESLDPGSTVMGSGLSLRRRLHLENLPAIFKSICSKFSNASLDRA